MVALAAAAVLLIAGRALAGAYADYLWYESVGALALWKAREAAIAMLCGGSAVGAALFAFANLFAVRRSVVSLVFPRRLANLEIGEEVPGRYLVGAAAALSIVLGVLLTVPEDNWTSLVLARSGQPFNVSDPYFGADLGFFVYWLPLENALWMWAFYLVLVVAVVVIMLYALTPSLKWQRGSVYASAYVRRHLMVLVGVMLLLLAWSFRLDMYSLLVDGSGPDGLFNHVDHSVGLPGDLLLSIATLGGALIVVWAGFVGHLRLATITVLAAVGLSLVVREIGPEVVQHSGTDAQRLARDTAYADTRAGYTRAAYGVEAVPTADTAVEFSSLAAAEQWIPIWDTPALARAVDAGRSPDDGVPPIAVRVTPTGLAADVVDAPQRDASARAPWTVARTFVFDADERGAPIHVSVSSASTGEDTPIEAPLVFPGATRHVIVADSLAHAVGTSLESFLSRLAVAWSMQNFRIVSGDLPQPHPTVMSHRDIRDRVSRYMPFFAQSRAVQPLMLGDSLYWAMDLYSWSDMYPLSRHALIVGDDRTYFRHAAVAIVQGSTGEVVVVPDTASALDPIAATWKQRLPALFGTWNGLPSGIRELLAPPIDGLMAQASAFGRYGKEVPRDAPRTIPVHDGSDAPLASDPLPFALPGSHVPAIAFPLVDDADRVHGLLIGMGGGTRLTAWYPVGPTTPRWSAILDRLRSVDSAGSAAREGPLAHGRVRAIPLRGGIAFAQPTYRWRPPNVPSLNRVAFLVGDTARSVAPPIAAAATPSVVAGPSPSKTSAAALYTTMRDALRRGDWATFGRAFDALGRALEGKKP
jgi:uncharacterized membrane protein (UPF0182 family)